MHQLRLTLLGVGLGSSVGDIWPAVFPDTPDFDEQRPRDGTRRRGVELPIGGILELLEAPGRKDIFRRPAASSTAGDLFSSDNPLFIDELPKFTDMSKSIINSDLHGYSRLAVGAGIFIPAESVEQAYEALSEITSSLNVDPKRMREVIYKVNWAVTSNKAPDGIINRITGFNIPTIIAAQLSSSGEATQLPGREVFVHIDIDINTSQGNAKEIEKSEALAIYNELVDLLCENAEKGECR
ncbi:hypothetical protein [Xanthobacter flavus]|uniref:hypothetical protein n=1 Tax=Xanthobacter flavus TaxID=281 RepID=UPI002491D558|nr:hypothetical protein [Xanthobacter flavus]